MRVHKAAAALAALTAILAAGCSSRVTGPQTQTRQTDGMSISVSIRPGLPQDTDSVSPTASAQTGDNTLIVTLRKQSSGAPIGNANITAAPSSSLVGLESAQSGRAQGNGVYYVPVRFAVPDTYRVTVGIDRPGKPETTATFTFTAS